MDEQVAQVESPPEPIAAVAVHEPPPTRWPELLAVVLLVVLCDLAIYRGQGFAGYALLFAVAPLLMAIGSPLRGKKGTVPDQPSVGARRNGPKGAAHRGGLSPFSHCWILGAMLLLLAAKMLWCGSVLLVAAGFALTVAFAAALSGLCPYVLEVGVFASQAVLAGYEGLIHHARSLRKTGPVVQRGKWLSYGLPAAAFVVFSLLFILANPDLLTLLGRKVDLVFNALRDWILTFAPSLWEVLFWLAALWIAVGLLRPVASRMLFEQMAGGGPALPGEGPAPVQTPLYSPLRNTLATVIVLFAVYLAFELATLWFREFPPGFYYSGYAHEGAAWLTVALALATAVLSLVFRGPILHDPRLPELRKLAWLWSLENMLLAAAVYRRLYIYIGFNGMTPMRMVGIFGMTAVVVGFVLVVWKIVYNHNFVWLMRRHLWTVALTVYLFALTPVDAIVTRYNVRRILAGDPAPSVQISVHYIGSEGILLLEPLLDCNNEPIREGVRAMLAQRQSATEALAARRRAQGWTALQIADDRVLRELTKNASDWSKYADPAQRDAALRRFHEYAYQWY
jgi:hypothetical protein